MNAATSGAFVLPESYLYTKEMIVDAVNHLDPNGILCAQFGEIDFDIKPNRVVRYLGTAREAFANSASPTSRTTCWCRCRRASAGSSRRPS
jgi:hypothetical protein